MSDNQERTYMKLLVDGDSRPRRGGAHGRSGGG